MTKYTRQSPSPRYQAMLEQYKQMHVEGAVRDGIPAIQTFPGLSLPPQAGKIRNMISVCQAKSILDYGCGKGLQYQPMQLKVEGLGEFKSIPEFWGGVHVTCYDPGYAPHMKLPVGQFDGVICTDVLEHIPEEDMPWVVKELFSYARYFVYTNAACYPAKKSLPNGENAHCTQREPAWWQELFHKTALEYPDVAYELWVQYKDNTGNFTETRLANFQYS